MKIAVIFDIPLETERGWIQVCSILSARSAYKFAQSLEHLQSEPSPTLRTSYSTASVYPSVVNWLLVVVPYHLFSNCKKNTWQSIPASLLFIAYFFGKISIAPKSKKSGNLVPYILITTFFCTEMACYSIYYHFKQLLPAEVHTYMVQNERWKRL